MRHKQKSQYFPYVAIPLVGFLFYASDVHRLNRYKVEALYSFDILIGALITIMVMVALYRYYPLSYKIIRYSTAWIMAVSLLSSFCLIGLIGYINDYPWGSYALIFFPWLTATFLTNPKEYTPVSRPFSKRPKSTGRQSENSEVFNHFN